MKMVAKPEEIGLFLCGDVMTGRGIDQILPHPVQPQLHERWAASALDYVALAERRCGPIARPVAPAYVWGDALAVLERFRPALRVINLETAVTVSEDAWPKGINYRMHPQNLATLAALGPDCCALANNHVLDWGRAGLAETLDALHAAGIRTAGAGRDLDEALAPACLRVQPRRPTEGGAGDPALSAQAVPADAGKRILVFSFAAESSGVPASWAVGAERSGVAWLAELSPACAASVLEAVERYRRPGDIVLVSIHWGSNWGYDPGPGEQAFARLLIDGGVDLVHGHSSHHPKGIEVYRDRLILYGCGDFLNDYEGIGGYEYFSPGLGLMYFPRLEARSGRLLGLALVPTRIERMQVKLASGQEAGLLRDMLDREGGSFGTAVVAGTGVDVPHFELRWA